MRQRGVIYSKLVLVVALAVLSFGALLCGLQGVVLRQMPPLLFEHVEGAPVASPTQVGMNWVGVSVFFGLIAGFFYWTRDNV